MNTLQSLAAPVGRILISLIFVGSGISLTSAALFHASFGDQMQMIMFMKNLALAGGFLMIVALGAGPWSIDNRNRS